MIIVLVIISLSLLILVHELGHFLAAKLFKVRVEEFGFGFPPRLFGKKKGETVYSVNLLPFGGFVKIFGEDDSERETFGSFSHQPTSRRALIIAAGVLLNIILGWLVLSFIFMIGAPPHLMIAEVATESPAANLNLKSGDVVLEARSNNFNLTDPVQSEAFIGLVEQAGENSLSLKLRRGRERLEINITPRLNPPRGEGRLGLTLVDIGFPPLPPLKAIGRGFTATLTTLKLTVIGFVDFFTKVFVSKGAIEGIAGPIGIFVLSAQAGSLGLVYLLQLMAFISLNLAVLNLIPFPALDGGRLLFLFFEKIKGAPVSRRFQGALNAFGFLVLILLMILVTIKDVGRLIQ